MESPAIIVDFLDLFGSRDSKVKSYVQPHLDLPTPRQHSCTAGL